ncbi:hypothetical protein D9615_000780 [Tricholomella constricta]|uniref:Uncharacterized protein n=1 Tax=Tricholomella constricta TaxID=117010 RepID=A0A8H5HQY1_9AGAR|nr:hypothetical protein D9615_000780 [Tricholomella constricta]
MSGRLSTVYDFSSLRIHPDGSRVQQDSSKNRNLRYAASVAQDFRGNWIARDAGGLGIVKRHRRVREDDPDMDDGEEVDLDAEREPVQHKGMGKDKEGMGGRKLKPRPAKRQKFMHDFNFLVPATSSSSFSDQQPLPSSDLLKSIHYFASTYYHERGQLMNVTKGYRQMRKQNLERRLEQKRKAEEDDDADALKPARRGGMIKGAGKKIYPKDMYKILDGSALVAIGMLMQEYVARMLEVRIPDGWEEMVQQAYAEAGVETPEEAGEDGDGEEDDDEEDIPGEIEECDKDSVTVGKENVDTFANDDASKSSSTNVDVDDGGGRQPREDSEEEDDGDDDESSSES